MRRVEQIVYEIYRNTKIEFRVAINSEIYSTLNFNESQEYYKKEFELDSVKCCIDICAAFSSNIDLLTIYIQDKLKSVFKEKKEILKLILDGEDISNYKAREIFNDFDEVYILNIFGESKVSEIYSYISQGYIEANINILEYNNGIIILGKLEDHLEHVNSIKETIQDLVSDKVYISYDKIDNIKNVRKVYLETQRKIELAIKYKINNSILDKKSLVFEEVISSISDEKRDEIICSFNQGLLQLNSEMTKTVEVFFKCGLNLSDAAKELYIHRNTLIYRIEKIKKLIGYDIRNFNEAVVFKIIFDIWKENEDI